MAVVYNSFAQFCWFSDCWLADRYEIQWPSTCFVKHGLTVLCINLFSHWDLKESVDPWWPSLLSPHEYVHRAYDSLVGGQEKWTASILATTVSRLLWIQFLILTKSSSLSPSEYCTPQLLHKLIVGRQMDELVYQGKLVTNLHGAHLPFTMFRGVRKSSRITLNLEERPSPICRINL